MAWTHFPMAAGDSVQPGVFAELSLAYVERTLAVTGGATGAAAAEHGAAGDNIQIAFGPTYASYHDWQVWIENHCTSFARTDYTYDHGGAPALTVNWNYTLATFRTAAGLNASGFTRRYWRQFTGLAAATYDDGSAFVNGHLALNASDNLVYLRSAGAWVAQGGPWGGTAPDTVTTYGTMQAGDFIDHLALNEIYQGFHALRWRLLGSTYYNFTDNNGRDQGGTSATWAAAKTGAQNSWDTGAPARPGLREATAAPLMYSLGYWDYAGGVFYYRGDLQGQKSRIGNSEDPWNGVSRSIEFYFYTVTAPVHETAGGGDITFDANGFGLFQDDWTKVTTVGPNTTTGVQYSAFVGDDVTYPVWCAEPLPAPVVFGDPQPTKERGFLVTAKAALCKFDVAGGFSKP